ncbi:MAG: nucleotidyltransferase family protein [Pyrinomonadaceae bacterium]
MTENSEPRVAGLLLAAGSSSRLGRPKQLVEFEGRTLIRKAAETLIDAGCSGIFVVLGSEVERSKLELSGLEVEIVVNDSWESGMGSSIVYGMRSILALNPVPDAVLISLCDQPFVTAENLRSFIRTLRRSEASAIAAHYNDVLGVPAIFSAKWFAHLAILEGGKGAQGLLRALGSEVESISLPEAAIDIDTPTDLLPLR